MEDTTQTMTLWDKLLGQHLTNELIISLLVIALLAVVIGYLLGRWSAAGRKATDTEALNKIEKELTDYKAAVNEHFGQTADLVDNLTESYKQVFDHLGDSARTLLSEEQVQEHLASRREKSVTLTYLSQMVNDQEAEKSAEKTSENEEQVIDKSSDSSTDTVEQKESQTETQQSIDESEQSEVANKNADLMNTLAEKVNKINDHK